jgi:hypothetical protein
MEIEAVMASGREPGGGAIVLSDVFTASAAFVSAQGSECSEVAGIVAEALILRRVRRPACGITKNGPNRTL